MTCLQAFLAGFVLGLGLARVSPSGKARASQARMRGFESRHPLQNNLRPAFGSEPPPMGGGSFKGGLFWFTSLRTSADSARFTSPQQSIRCKNNNPDTFATFFRLGTPFRPFKAKMTQSSGGYLRFCTSGYDPRGSQQSPIAKILQSRPIFCFWTPRRPRTNTAARIGWSRFRKQDRVVVIPRAGWGGHDAAGRMGQSQRRGQGGPAAASWARLIGRNVVGEVDRPNSVKDPKGMESLSFSLVRRDALPH